MVLVNGKSRQVVEVSDRGFQYGDGLFETIAVSHRKPLFWLRHMERLALGCERLHIPLPDPELLADDVDRLCRDSVERAVVKLIVTRGSGGRGYRLPDHPIVTRVVTLHSSPLYPDSHYSLGVNVRLCETRLGHNPRLAGIKHLNRLEQILARAEWHDENTHEGLLCDHNGYIVEGTMSNIFMVVDQKLVTPKLDQCGVAGIVRQWIIDNAKNQGVDVTETYIGSDMIDRASELFLTNSIIGLWPIGRLQGRSFTVGDITRRLQAAYADACREEVFS